MSVNLAIWNGEMQFKLLFLARMFIVVLQIFLGNDGSNDTVKHNLTKSVRARFIRFVPTNHHSRKALRVEIYGVLKPTGDFITLLIKI